jgi:alkylated DNA repair protein (DNA oxidative demethylase)
MANLAQDSVRCVVGPTVQAALLAQVRGVVLQAPLVRPTAGGTPMRVRTSAAGRYGWVADGTYRYAETQANGRAWPPIPQLWRDLADDAVGAHLWDCAIINWYDEDASLGWHRDLSERDHTLPIVTISLGDDCRWAVRLDEGTPIHRCQLESGSITVLEGNTRLALHTVERIVAAPLLSPLGATRGRVSITLRVAR